LVVVRQHLVEQLGGLTVHLEQREHFCFEL